MNMVVFQTKLDQHLLELSVSFFNFGESRMLLLFQYQLIPFYSDSKENVYHKVNFYTVYFYTAFYPCLCIQNLVLHFLSATHELKALFRVGVYFTLRSFGIQIYNNRVVLEGLIQLSL